MIKKKLKCLNCIVTITLLLLFNSSCGIKEDEISKESLITVLDPFVYDAKEEESNFEYEGYHFVLDEYLGKNPEAMIRQYSASDFSFRIGAMIDNECVPDVFYTSAHDLDYYYENGYILDPELYSYPVLCERYGIVMYDKEVFNNFGYDEFPQSFDDLYDIKTKEGYQFESLIGLNNSGGGAALNYFLGPLLLNMKEGQWIKGLLSFDENGSYLDDCFLEAVSKTEMLFEGGIFNEDVNTDECRNVKKLFLNGKIPAVILNTHEARALLLTLEKEENLSSLRPENIGIARIPLLSEDKEKMVGGIDNFLVISSKLLEDDEKLKRAVDFCEYVTGEAYSDYMMEKYGMRGRAEAKKGYIERIADSSLDPWIQYFEIIDSSEKAELFSSYLDASVYYSECTIIRNYLDGRTKKEKLKRNGRNEYTLMEMANDLQNLYEQYIDK